MECCVFVKLIQCMNGLCSSYMFVLPSAVPPLTHTPSHTYPHTHTLTHTPSHTHPHTHTLTHTLTHTPSHKVRMQSGTLESFSKRQSCAKFFRQIYSEEGVRGLYRVSVGGEGMRWRECGRLSGSVFNVWLVSPLSLLSQLPSSPIVSGCWPNSATCSSDSRCSASVLRLLQEAHP